MRIHPVVLPGLKTVDDVVAQIWETDKNELFTRTRKREVVEARMVAMYYRHYYMGQSQRHAAGIYNHDSSMIPWAKKTITDLSQINVAFREKFYRFEAEMKSIYKSV